MKTVSPLLLCAFGVVTLAGSSPAAPDRTQKTAAVLPQADAPTQTWNPGGAGGGTGSWAGNNWDSGAAWTAGNIALFGGAAGTVTTGTQTGGGLNFTTGGYTLSGGTLTLAPASGSAFVVTTNTTGTETVSSTLAGAAGGRLTKTGPGTLAVTSITGGTAAGPSVGTITGGTFNATTGLFSSVLQVGYGNVFGTAPTVTTPVVTLDAGTLKVTGTNANALATTRGVLVNAGGGAIADGGGNTLNSQITNNAAAASSLYLSNPTGTISTFTNTGPITGTGSVTWNGLGTAVFQAANTYTGGTTINKGTLQLGAAAGYNGTTVAAGSLGSNALTIATGATLSLQGAVLRFDLSNGADQLTIPSGNLVVGGVNNVRLATGSTLTPGTYPLISTSVGSLTGSFEMDGGSTLTVPAPSLIKQVGGTFYRLTLQNSSTAEGVVVSAAPAKIINEMPLGSSITEGVSAQGATYAGGGYRSQLYQLLVNDGRFTPNFVGSNTVLDNNAAGGYNVLTGANQLHHEGHSGFTTTQILTNLNAGGNWLAPGNGVNPDYVTLSIGGNDYGVNGAETTGPVLRTDAIVSDLVALRPAAQIIVANLFYRTQTATNNGATVVVGDLQNTYYNPGVPAMVYNHTLAGHHVAFVDQYTAVTPNNNVTNIGSDGIHPVTPGYNLMANTWYTGLATGSAYWTGAQDSQWNTVTGANGTNFAQNYPLTTPRQSALDAGTDVYFNSNASALATTVGADLQVRGVNFAAGASGPVTVGGGNTLTLNAGGVTVQPGTGAPMISSKIALGTDQTWGNVSANALTVSGAVSGAHALKITGSYTVQTPVSATGNATVAQTYTGTGPIVLSGANTYSGGTAVSSGTLVVGNASGTGTGTGSVSVDGGAVLTNNGSIGGDTNLNGTANGNGTFGGAVLVNSGGTFAAQGVVGGSLNVGTGGLVALSGGALAVNGGVVNNGTIRLAHGAALSVGNGKTFVNNGVLDLITGSFNTLADFTNNGVVLDSSVVRAKSVNLSGSTLTILLDGYTGHSYQLQRGDALASDSFSNRGAPQSGTTGNAITVTDDISNSPQGFYRVVVDP